MREADVGPVVAWERRLGLSEGALELLRREAVGPGWQGGRSEDEIEDRLRVATGLDGALFERLLRDLEGVPLMVPEIRELVCEVRARGIRTAIVRNAGPRWRARMADVDWLWALFDAVVVSGEVQVAKPDPAIYLLAAQTVGVAPEACVFVDDREEFAAGAAACGMRAVVMSSPAQGVADIRAALGL